MGRHHEMFNIHRYSVHHKMYYINSYSLFPFRLGWRWHLGIHPLDESSVTWALAGIFQESKDSIIIIMMIIIITPSNRNPLASCWAWLTLSPLPNRLRLFSSSSSFLSEDKKRSTFLFIPDIRIVVYPFDNTVLLLFVQLFVMFARLYPVSNGNNLSAFTSIPLLSSVWWRSSSRTPPESSRWRFGLFDWIEYNELCPRDGTCYMYNSTESRFAFWNEIFSKRDWGKSVYKAPHSRNERQKQTNVGDGRKPECRVTGAFHPWNLYIVRSFVRVHCTPIPPSWRSSSAFSPTHILLGRKIENLEKID